MLIRPLQKGSIFYTLIWLLHKYRRPDNSTAAAEILAVGNAIHEGKNMRDSMCSILGKPLKLTVASDSKDIYNSPLTQRNAVDRTSCADVNIVRYEYEPCAVGNIV